MNGKNGTLNTATHMAENQQQSAHGSVVLLQGPLGPFFADVAHALKAQGVQPHRICFNDGDVHFGDGEPLVRYTGKADDWRGWLKDYLQRHDIKAVLCYGDSRFYHRMAKQACNEADVSFFACEEGYVRPGFVTLEEGGNNANSLFPAKFKAGTLDDKPTPAPAKIDSIFKHQFWFAVMYYIAKDWKFWSFRRYRHHRTGNWASEMMAWLIAGYRKHLVSRFRERGLTKKLTDHHAGALFVVPLQVAVDTQMIYHSRFETVAEFIEEVLVSFAANAPEGAHLVMKHHPMDRGFNHYGTLINRLSRKLHCSAHVTYACDVDLAALLNVAKGCVTVNSTVAGQSLHAGVPALTLGKSMLETAGLTAQCSLDEFWQNTGTVNWEAVCAYHHDLVAHTQIPGSFYHCRTVAAQAFAMEIAEHINK